MSSVLFIVVAASYFAHSMGFTYSLGAFVAGMIIAETKYFHKVEADIAPFKDILLGTFFILIGMKIDLHVFINNFWLIVGLFLGILIFKSALTFIALSRHTSKDVALKTAISIAQVGEFALVIFAIATMTGLMDSELTKIVMLVTILSMVVTPFVIPYTQKIVSFFFKEAHYLSEVKDIGNKKDHIIICGYGKVGRHVEQHLEFYGYDYIIVDNNPTLVQQALNKGLEAYLGDMSKSAIIEALHVKNSAAVIITLDNADIKHLICQKILQSNPYANIIVQIASKEERAKLKDELQIINAVDGETEIARILVERVMQCQLKSIS
jgi:CPA2 family monovalent cation:H+ antiporter-2